jgi:hypothetical protein
MKATARREVMGISLRLEEESGGRLHACEKREAGGVLQGKERGARGQGRLREKRSGRRGSELL